MKRVIAICIVLSVASMSLSAPPGEQRYDPGTTPKFAVGDVVTRIYTQTYQTSFLDKQGEKFREILVVIDSTEDQDVTAVGETGRVTEFRSRIVSAKMEYTLTPIGRDAEKTTVELSDVQCMVRRTGRAFRPDTTTISSGTTEALSAPELAMLKRFFHERMDFFAHQESNSLLLPPSPVSVGDEWSADEDALTAWIRNVPAARRVKIERAKGSFRMSGIKGGAAILQGQIRYGFTLGDVPAAATSEVSSRIDLASGPWLSNSINGRIAAEGEEIIFRANARAIATIVYRPSSGKRPASAPVKRYNLGWARAPKDTNNYRDKGHGISLTIPKTYAFKKIPAEGNVIAAFISGEDRSISITVKDSYRPVEMDKLTTVTIGNLYRSIPNYIVLETKGLILPGNVPAKMLVAQGYEGTVTFITLFAIDGTRLVSVMAAGPSKQPAYLKEMKQIVQTLRVFEPDLSAAQ